MTAGTERTSTVSPWSGGTVHAFDAAPDLLARFLAVRPDAQAERLLAAGPGAWPRAAGATWRNFLAENGAGRALGRLTAIVHPAFADPDGRPLGQLGYIALDDDPALLAALLAPALDWLRGQPAGPRQVLAPMAFDAWHSYRWRIAGFEHPPFPGEPDNPACYPDLLAGHGFLPVSEHVTKTIDDPGAAVAGWARFHARALARGYRFRAADPARLGEALGQAYRLSLALFRHLGHFTPLPEAEFRALYAGVGALLEPEGLLFADSPDGQAAGLSFSFRLPGRPDALYLKTFGVLPELRAGGLAPALASETYQRWLRRGVQRVHHCLMAAGGAAEDFDQGLGVVTRRYVLFGRSLGPVAP